MFKEVISNKYQYILSTVVNSLNSILYLNEIGVLYFELTKNNTKKCLY